MKIAAKYEGDQVRTPGVDFGPVDVTVVAKFGNYHVWKVPGSTQWAGRGERTYYGTEYRVLKNLGSPGPNMLEQFDEVKSFEVKQFPSWKGARDAARILARRLDGVDATADRHRILLTAMDDQGAIVEQIEDGRWRAMTRNGQRRICWVDADAVRELTRAGLLEMVGMRAYRPGTVPAVDPQPLQEAPGSTEGVDPVVQDPPGPPPPVRIAVDVAKIRALQARTIQASERLQRIMSEAGRVAGELETLKHELATLIGFAESV